MRIACVQMNMLLGKAEQNFAHAQELVRAAAENADVVVLPETWNSGFFPRENLAECADVFAARTKEVFGNLAKENRVNIVAGSVANIRNSTVYNTACIFDREGYCVGEYDKTHLFTPMHEQDFFTPGHSLCSFTIDNVKCGIMICYDVRFPELSRMLALRGIEMLFVVSQWPEPRIPHLRILTTARAVENQMFVVCCNSCGTAGETKFGGNSAIIDPWGNTLALAGSGETTVFADCDLSVVGDIRASINVFHDRCPRLYTGLGPTT